MGEFAVNRPADRSRYPDRQGHHGQHAGFHGNAGKGLRP